MSIGHPDFGQAGASNFVAPVPDLGELAMRTGGLFSFDRAGNVAWASGFEHGQEGFRFTGFVSPAYMGVRTDKAYQGAGYLYAITRALLNENLQAQRFLPPIPTGKVGLYSVVQILAGIPEARMYLYPTKGGLAYNFGLYVNVNTAEFGYINSANVAVKLSSIPGGLQDSGLWLHTKLVVDMDTGKYVRANLDGTSYSLAGIAPFTSAVAGLTSQQALLQLYSRSAAQAAVGWDNLIFTINEA